MKRIHGIGVIALIGVLCWAGFAPARQQMVGTWLDHDGTQFEFFSDQTVKAFDDRPGKKTQFSGTWSLLPNGKVKMVFTNNRGETATLTGFFKDDDTLIADYRGEKVTFTRKK